MGRFVRRQVVGGVIVTMPVLVVMIVMAVPMAVVMTMSRRAAVIDRGEREMPRGEHGGSFCVRGCMDFFKE